MKMDNNSVGTLIPTSVQSYLTNLKIMAAESSSFLKGDKVCQVGHKFRPPQGHRLADLALLCS